MSTHASPVLRFLRRFTAPPGDTTDAELLRRFAGQQDEAAFTALLQRHGPMVLGVCLRLLRNEHDAEDALQATFLVLARRVRSIGRPELLGNWLYGMAYRTALKARSEAAERRVKEQKIVRVPVEEATPAVVWADLRPVLDEEVHRLPEKFRVAFVLCCLQGRTNEEAARLIGCPKGTVLSRLATARERLRTRLTRRDIVLSAGLLAAAVSDGPASAALPPLLIGPTARAALAVAAGQVPTGLVSVNVVVLMKGTLKAMLLSKLQVVMAVLLAVFALGTGGILLVHRTVGAEPPASTAERKTGKAKEEDAIQGNWTVANLEQVYYEPTKDERAAFKEGSLKVVITADKIVYRDKDEATYKLDPSKTPRRIDMMVASDKKSVTVAGIYSLDGDELKLCFVGRVSDIEPPASFDIKKAKPGTFPTCWTLRRDDAPREKGKDVEKKADAKEDAAAKELKAMEGDWDVVGLERDGRKASADDAKGMRWNFKGSTMQPTDPGEKLGAKAEVKIDPSRSPKHLDLVVLEGDLKGKTLQGIYKLEEGKLTVCLRDEQAPEKGRPKDFTAEKGSNQGMITLEKAKK